MSVLVRHNTCHSPNGSNVGSFGHNIERITLILVSEASRIITDHTSFLHKWTGFRRPEGPDELMQSCQSNGWLGS